MPYLLCLEREAPLRECLRDTFNLTSCLANYLRDNLSSASDPVTIQVSVPRVYKMVSQYTSCMAHIINTFNEKKSGNEIMKFKQEQNV